MDGMTNEVRAHYSGTAAETSVVGRVRAMLDTLGDGPLPPERLAGLDHFHVRGAEATAELANPAAVAPGDWWSSRSHSPLRSAAATPQFAAPCASSWHSSVPSRVKFSLTPEGTKIPGQVKSSIPKIGLAAGKSLSF